MAIRAVRGTTAYAFGELFKEDLRYVRCTDCSPSTQLKTAFENTFTAAKGSDGHRVFSIARFLGPISGGVAAATWRPGGFERRDLVRQVGLAYGLGYMRTLVRALVKH